jgi:hypothetical protein
LAVDIGLLKEGGNLKPQGIVPFKRKQNVVKLQIIIGCFALQAKKRKVVT